MKLNRVVAGTEMDDTDASSIAAQSARQVEPQKDSFFKRLFSGFKAMPSTIEEHDMHPQTATNPAKDHALVNLNTMRVDDVMVPKVEIIAVSDAIEKDELLSVFKDSEFTRIPVYSGTLDTPIGMAHLKDFVFRHGLNGEAEEFDLPRMLRPLLFVPPSMPVGVLLTKMQSQRQHMALVIDEYGGVDGLVTIEDLIEQVVGEIEDEHDNTQGRYWVEEKPQQYLALSKTPLEDFEQETGVDLTSAEEVDEQEIETLGGLVFMLAGHVPARGEVVPHPAGLEFEVVDADPRRIKRLRVRLNPSEHAAE
jgi:magnesium and cobalt transporter